MQKLSLFLFIGLFFSTCSLKKTTRENANRAIPGNDLKSIEKAVTENAFEFEYLSFRAGGQFTGMGMDQSISLSVRMKRHEIVWISAQAMLGIEFARLLVTRDSVYLIQNFPERSYHEYAIDSLASFLSMPLTVTQFQDLLVGNPLLPFEGAEVGMQADSLVVEKKLNSFILREFYDPAKAKIARNFFQDQKGSGQGDVYYGNFTRTGTKELPVKVNIFVQRPDLSAQLDLQYSSISLETISSFPFRKPVN